MKREDLELYLLFVTAVFTVIPGGLAVYVFLKEASEPERAVSLGLIAAVPLMATSVLAWRTRILHRIARAIASTVRVILSFARQNTMLLMSLAAACVLLVFLAQRTQDIVLAAVAMGLLLTIVCLALGAVRLLVITRPSLLGLLTLPIDLWQYDFVEGFDEADHRSPSLPGSVIRVHDLAVCTGGLKRGIFEHPPDDPNECSILTYKLTLPPGTRPIELRGFIGIQYMLIEPPGVIRWSERTQDNGVQFEIVINGEVEFQEQKYTSQWEEVRIPLPRQDTLGIRFRTNCLRNAHYNWAVWGEPLLTEVTE